MARPDYYTLADRIYDGHLRERLSDWRTEGKSFDDIAFELRVNNVITVTGETVRQWCLTNGIHANPVGEAS